MFCDPESLNIWICLLRFSTLCYATRSPKQYESAFFEIFDVLFCDPESHKIWKCIFWDFRRYVLRPGVPENLKVHFLRFSTLCSATQSPWNYESAFCWDVRRYVMRPRSRSPWKSESAFFEMFDVMFCDPESQKIWKSIFYKFQTFKCFEIHYFIISKCHNSW